LEHLLAALEVHTLVMAVVMVVMGELTAAVAVLVGIPVRAVRAAQITVTEPLVQVVVVVAHMALDL
jgi:hypothetical protein